MSIKLSVCIPTYNRATFLGAALDSVIRQATDEVEIVVSDNASTDHTEALVREYQARFPRIRYHRNPENLGADRNFLKVVELAEGEYCWLLGSDDALGPSALRQVLQRLGSADIYQLDAVRMSSDMSRVLLSHEQHLSSLNGARYDCKNNADMLRVFKDALGFNINFTFMSCLVFRRFLWNEQRIDGSLLGSGWIHVAKLFAMMCAGAQIEYLRQPLVLHRTDNDSLLASAGRAKRQLIDLDYLRVAYVSFSDRAEIRDIIRYNCAARLFSVKALLIYRRLVYLSDGAPGIRLVSSALAEAFRGMPAAGLKIFIWNHFPLWLITTLQSLRRGLRARGLPVTTWLY